MSKLFEGYSSFLKEIREEIKKRRFYALQTVNRELMRLYWEIGKRILEKQEQKSWGKSVVEKLALDLKIAFPDMNGLSAQNLWRMRQFYLEYKNHEFLSTLSREISWSSNVLIISRVENLIRLG